MRHGTAAPSATVAAALAYALAAFGVLPNLSYYPRLGSWSFQALAGEPGIRWYGWMAYLVLGGLLGWVAGGWSRRPVPWRVAVAIPLAAFLLMVWHERHWFGW